MFELNRNIQNSVKLDKIYCERDYLDWKAFPHPTFGVCDESWTREKYDEGFKEKSGPGDMLLGDSLLRDNTNSQLKVSTSFNLFPQNESRDPTHMESVHSLEASTVEFKKKGRKPELNGLKKRKDIVMKSWLRKIRRFHWDRLKRIAQLTSRVKLQKKELINFLPKYISQEFGMEPNEEFINVLDSIFFIGNHRNKRANSFGDAYSSYNKAKLHKLMEDPYFKCLVYHYYFETKFEVQDIDTKIGIQIMLNL